MTAREQLGYIADIIGIISGIMAIVGLSGLLTWSIFHRGQPLPDRILAIFAYSMKTSICALSGGILILLAYIFWEFLIAMTGGNSSWKDLENGYYARKTFLTLLFSPENLVATGILLAVLALLIPPLVTLWATLYQWSPEPLRGLWKKITNR